MKKLVLIMIALSLVGCSQPQETKQEESKQTVKCTFVGDTLYEEPYYKWIGNDQEDKGYYDSIQSYFQNDDLSIANLEVPIGGKELGISGSGYSFNTSYDIGNQLASLGLEVVSTANNHAYDRKDKGVDHTLDFLRQKDILGVGTYYNQQDRDAGKYKTINGIKFGFISYTYDTNQAISQQSLEKVAVFLDNQRNFTQEYKDLLTKEVSQTRKNCDVLIAMMHWGNEFTYHVTDQQREVSQLLSDLGVHIIIGNHSHCPQPIEYIGNTLCMYSLGNFISADPYVNRATNEFKNAYNLSFMIQLDIIKDKDQISVHNIQCTPIINYYDKNIENFKLVPYQQYTQDLETSHYHYQDGLTKEWITKTTHKLVPDNITIN